MPKLLFLSRQELEILLDLRKVMEVIERGFVSFHRKEAISYPVVREFIQKHEGIFGIKAGFVQDGDYLGFKAGGYWKNNPLRDIAAHQSLIVLYDPETGIPRTVMDGNFITIIRTGAVGAIASKYLAKNDSKIVAIIGCGVQGRIQLDALRTNFSLEDIRCYDAIQERAEAYVEEMSTPGSCVTSFARPEEAVSGADVIVTTTPSTQPVIFREWVSAGTHINAMGADTKGKQEIDPKLYQQARVVADDLKQCLELGETQHNIEFVKTHGIYAQLGEIVSGEKPGRVNAAEITLFDATGIAFQDLVTAGLALNLAKDNKIGTWVEL